MELERTINASGQDDIPSNGIAHRAVMRPTSARAPSFFATWMYCSHRPTSPLNFLRARSKIWNCRRTRA